MARKVTTLITDDIDGSPDASTMTFSLDGVTYEIDLCDTNAEKLREYLHPYMEKARRMGGRRNSRTTSSTFQRPTARRNDVKAIRAWARENGWELSDRGRISGEVQRAYEEANSS